MTIDRAMEIRRRDTSSIDRRLHAAAKRAVRRQSPVTHKHTSPPDNSSRASQRFADVDLQAVDDASEQEAERVAAHMGALDPSADVGDTRQRAERASLHGVDNIWSDSGGHALDSETKTMFEHRLGHDFSALRVHSDEYGAACASEQAASAVTVGAHIYFGRDKYQPRTSEGQRLIAHELIHVVQQAAVGRPRVDRQALLTVRPRATSRIGRSPQGITRTISDTMVTRTDVTRIFNQDEGYNETQTQESGEGWIEVGNGKEQKVAFVTTRVQRVPTDAAEQASDSSSTEFVSIEPEFRYKTSPLVVERRPISSSETVVNIPPPKRAEEKPGGLLASVGGFLKGAGQLLRGLGKSAWGLVSGVYHVVRYPIETLEGLYSIVRHPIRTMSALYGAVKKREAAILAGDFEALGQTVGDIAALLLAPEAEAAEGAEIAEAAKALDLGTGAADVTNEFRALASGVRDEGLTDSALTGDAVVQDTKLGAASDEVRPVEGSPASARQPEPVPAAKPLSGATSTPDPVPKAAPKLPRKRVTPQRGQKRPSMPRDARAPRADINAFKEPFNNPNAVAEQREIMELAKTDPRGAGRRYEELVAQDIQGGASVSNRFRREGRRMDIGTEHEVTIEGAHGSMGSGKLNQLWDDLMDKRNVTLTVPRLSKQAHDQLARLLAQARKKLRRAVIIVVRETLP